jgi:hypothetical protein
MPRDNFSSAVKAALAQRAGYRCSFPRCSAVTAGPSNEGDDATSNTGEAAHISAASAGPGARRYDGSMSSVERSSINNAIWCCRTHAKLIDTDEVLYSVTLLKKWKRIAEKTAELRQAYGDINFAGEAEFLALGLAEDVLEITQLRNENRQIGALTHNACVAAIWGESVANALRDFLIEHVRNVIEHGGATLVRIEFHEKRVAVIDSGQRFDLDVCREESFGRGGSKAYRALLALPGITASTSVTADTGENRLYLSFVKTVEDLLAANPCSLSLNKHELVASEIDFSKVGDCQTVYVVTAPFATYSDSPYYENVLSDLLPKHKKITLVLTNASAGVVDEYQKKMPAVKVISMPCAIT